MPPVAKTLEALRLPSIRGSYTDADHEVPQQKDSTRTYRAIGRIRGSRLSKTSDIVNHVTLFEGVEITNLRPNLKRWIIHYAVDVSLKSISEQEFQSP